MNLSHDAARKEKGMKKAGLITKDCLDMLSREIKPGKSTKALDEKAAVFIAARGARAAFKGYKGFPGAICTSRNQIVVHGIPRESEILNEGDIISVDVGVEYDGYFADAARTFAVGDVGAKAKRLMSAAKDALHKGIKMARAGNRVGDISWAIQSHVEAQKLSVVRAFVGHGIGKKIHEEPEVPNFGKPQTGAVLEDGMALAIEPMVNAGTSEVEILGDGWTAVTKDGEISAHFEHTIFINGEAADILT